MHCDWRLWVSPDTQVEHWVPAHLDDETVLLRTRSADAGELPTLKFYAAVGNEWPLWENAPASPISQASRDFGGPVGPEEYGLSESLSRDLGDWKHEHKLMIGTGADFPPGPRLDDWYARGDVLAERVAFEAWLLAITRAKHRPES
ncbi:hypothetical protein [Gulosibacter sp. 10]|uniref:hypothetical protein n=1 Tax=Gulosibacter sp. 10 TaxID=1255570 RepID=UPI00097F323F|nr:hypothetical protein [Gulosibacter sp. 10]SJM71515.1 hypothetical protein FM112_16400 [Gulosibacter sp. 10]